MNLGLAAKGMKRKKKTIFVAKMLARKQTALTTVFVKCWRHATGQLPVIYRGAHLESSLLSSFLILPAPSTTAVSMQIINM